MLVGTTWLLSIFGDNEKKSKRSIHFCSKMFKKSILFVMFWQCLTSSNQNESNIFFYQIQQPIILWTCFRFVNRYLVLFIVQFPESRSIHQNFPLDKKAVSDLVHYIYSMTGYLICSYSQQNFRYFTWWFF